MRVYIKDHTVIEIIPEINPAMPGLTPEQRYPASFLALCLNRPDDEEVKQGWQYDEETDTFYDPDAEEDGDTE